MGVQNRIPDRIKLLRHVLERRVVNKSGILK